MSATWQGIPLASAIIVRHTPNEGQTAHGRQAKGAISCTSAKDAAYYIARKGRYATKGDIERHATRDDVALSRNRSQAARALDYATRQNEFAKKGASLQVDASLWGAEGALDVDEIAKEMQAAGGAFIDSVVSVKREYAATLGLTEKQDFERMLRATWTHNVEQWELTVKDGENNKFLGKAIADPQDIRWAAAFHTDAEMGLHCHIYTWSAKGEIPDHATVTEKTTALGKEEILRFPYNTIRQERNLRATYLRDLSIETTKRELGLSIQESRQRELLNRARIHQYPERLPEQPDLPSPARARAQELMDTLAMELASGEGRLSRNYQAQAVARDLIELVEQESPSAAALRGEREQCAEAKCDLKGLSKAGEERTLLLRQEREETKSRMTRALMRSMAPREVAQRELRPDLVALDMKEREGWENVSFSQKLIEAETEQAVVVRMPKMPNEKTIQVQIPTNQTADINRGGAKLAAIEKDGSYEIVSPSDTASHMSGEELIKRLGRADMPRIARMNPDEGQDARRQAERAARLAHERTLARMFGTSKDQTAQRISAKWGCSLREAREIAKYTERTVNADKLIPWRKEALLHKTAQLLVSYSPKMQKAINERVNVLENEGVTKEEARSRVTQKAVDSVSSALERENLTHASKTNSDKELVLPMGADAISMIGSLLEASLAATDSERGAMSRSLNRKIEPQRNLQRDQERSR